MTKSSTALMSLVAAVPGAFLAFLLVMAFLSHADKMGGMLNGVVGFTLLCAVAAALMPVGIMIFGGPRGAAKPKAPKKKQGKDATADDEEAGGAAVGLEDADDSESTTGTADADESGEFESSASSDIHGESDDSGEMMDAFDDEQTDRRQASDEWDDSESELSDEFEFDDALSDDDLELDFEDEEK